MSAAGRLGGGRPVGVLLGAAVGDALGWPQEVRGGLVGGQRARDRREPEPRFVAWTRSGGYYARRYSDPVAPGEYSDDTQLLLAVARACLAGEHWYEQLTAVELPAWPLYQRGGGGAVLSASGSWADLTPPWLSDGSPGRTKIAGRYAGAGANGVAMRIAPHVVCAYSRSELLDRVLRDGLATHGHPRALVGALVYAFALRAALEASGPLSYGDLIDAGRVGLISAEVALEAVPTTWLSAAERSTFAHAWDQTNYETEELLRTADASIRRGATSNADATLESLGCTDPKVNGAGTVSAVAAIYVASRFAARPMNGLLTAAFLRKGDTDTLASMAGALLGAVHGADWLGELALAVQDRDYIADLATALARGRDDRQPPAPAGRDLRRVREDWRKAIRTTRRGDRGIFPDGRPYQVTDVVQLPGANVKRVRLRFDDGQTALHDVSISRTTLTQPTFDDLPSTVDTPGELPSAHLVRTPQSRARPAPAELVSVTALTNNLRRAVAFYAQLLGSDIAVRGEEAQITNWFRLRQSAHKVTQGEARTVAVTLRVSDLDAVVRRLSAEDGALPSVSALRDPDGRIVRLEEG